MLVDDAPTVRRLGSAHFVDDPEVVVVATAPDGPAALSTLSRRPVDVVVLDVAMPGMGGLEVLRAIRRDHPQVKVVMFSSLTRHQAELTLDALAAGASDYVPKPMASDPRGPAAAWDAVRACIAGLFPTRVTPLPHLGLAATLPPRARPSLGARSPLVVVGSSTGGPTAVERFLKALGPRFAAPVVVAQHMPAVFTAAFARRLAQKTGLDVREAANADRLERGVVLVAPGGSTTEVADRNGLQTTVTPASGSGPSVDALFRSAAEISGAATTAVVLTGMGNDGLVGARALRAKGARVFAQDQDSCVVWGMPRAVAEAGIAEYEGTPEALAQRVAQLSLAAGSGRIARR